MSDEETFRGSIAQTIAESTPWWPERRTPPDGAPNLVFIVFDDVGFADFGCYGSEIETPNLDAMAGDGLRYTGFHTTALCSPTRACLLTGRNHHSVGMAGIADWDLGFPGSRGRVTHRAGTLAEMLRPLGYTTHAVGKWHLTPSSETSAVGPFDQWPTQRGFDHFYGFLHGETNQWHPELVRDNHHIDAPDRPGYHLTEDLVDQSMAYLSDHVSLAPDRRFFLYLSLGACHAPHHVPQRYIDKYLDVFAKGWDQTRTDRLARQIEMGIVPPGTELPERNTGVRPWADLSTDAQRLAVQLQAAYAGMLEHADEHLGRLVAHLQNMGIYDDTLIVTVSDNGASPEGSPFGTTNSLRNLNSIKDTVEVNLPHLAEIGQAHLNNNYPWGWAMAGNTPLKRYKQNTHGGGVRDPLIMSWPNGIADRGGIRPQFHHVSDIVPTILEILDLDAPDRINGVAQMPIEGTSARYTFDRPDVPTRKDIQYFEMLGSRGLWHDGWKAVAWHRPGSDFNDDQWELYNLDEDFGEVHDLAAAEPARLARLVELWWVEAGRKSVLPLYDRLGVWGVHDPARQRRRYVLRPTDGRIPTDAAPDVRNRSWTIEATYTAATSGADGVLIAHGDSCGGWSLYIRDGVVVHDYNVAGVHHTVRGAAPTLAGQHVISYRFRATGEHRGESSLAVDGQIVDTIEIDRTPSGLIAFAGLEVGRAPLPGVGDFPAPKPFTGELQTVIIELAEPESPQDPDAQLRGAMATQ